MELAQRAQTGGGLSARMGVSPPATGTRVAVAVMGIIGVWLVATAIAIAVTSLDDRAADRSYDQVEAIRGGVGLNAGAVDRSHDQIESLRGGIILPVGPVDRSYEQVESTRAELTLPVAPVDRSYDQVERLRAGGSGG